MKPSYSTLQRKIRRLKADIATLEQWKKEQMIVAADTHYHDIARAIGLKLGHYIAPRILPAILELKSQLANLRFSYNNLFNWAEADSLKLIEKAKEIDQLRSDLNQTQTALLLEFDRRRQAEKHLDSVDARFFGSTTAR